MRCFLLNEIDNLRPLVEEIGKYAPDGTGTVADELRREHARVHVLHRLHRGFKMCACPRLRRDF